MRYPWPIPSPVGCDHAEIVVADVGFRTTPWGERRVQKQEFCRRCEIERGQPWEEQWEAPLP